MANHPPSAEGVVLVDFDGTLAPWGALWDVKEFLPGAIDAVRLLHELGYKIVIFTSRLSPSWHVAEGRDPTFGPLAQRDYLERLLIEHGIPFDFITAEKIPAVLMLDDKAMRVTSERPLLEAVRDFIADGDYAL